MNFGTTILLISFVITIFLSLLIIPILKKIKIGQIERDDGPESHLKKQGTPTMGGIIFIIGIILSTIIGIIYCRINISENEMSNIIPMLFLITGFGIVGFIDDFIKLILKNTKGLKPKYKMIGLLIISILYVSFIIKNIGTGLIIPILKIEITLPKLVYIPFVILVILGTTNAVNLTDGVDGLSSSVSAIIITCLTVIAMLKSIPEIAIIGCSAVRMCFRIFNV